jgi:hypothetical protein
MTERLTGAEIQRRYRERHPDRYKAKSRAYSRADTRLRQAHREEWRGYVREELTRANP